MAKEDIREFSMWEEDRAQFEGSSKCSKGMILWPLIKVVGNTPIVNGIKS